jgi:uncharacterized protein (DUF2062 family)
MDDDVWERSFKMLVVAAALGWLLAQIITIPFRLYFNYEEGKQVQHEAQLIQRQVDSNRVEADKIQQYINQLVDQTQRESNKTLLQLQPTPP